MLKWIATAILAGSVGIVAGAGLFYLFGPLLIDRVVVEPLPLELAGTEQAKGAFRDGDKAHKGRGDVHLITASAGTRLLRFTYFEVTNVPDPKVYLVAARDIAGKADVKAAKFVSLGTLKGNKGDQTYILPKDLDPAAYPSVVVWCEAFGIPVAVAELGK